MSARPKPRNAEATQRGNRKSQRRGRNRLEAMSHPIRAQAFRMLVERGGEMSPSQIGWEIDEPSSLVSYHLKQLVRLDCAELVREAPVEGKGAVEHFYIATERAYVDIDDWGEFDPLIAEGICDEVLQKIVDDYTLARDAGAVAQDDQEHCTRTPLILDQQGVLDSMENFESCRLRQSKIELESAERRAESGEAGIPVSSSLLFFKMPRKPRKSS